jgi:uncharacterized protein YukE
MEIEELYNMDSSPVNRPKTTQAVIDGFAKLLDAQDDKGIKKYGTTMDEADDKNYDWRLMAMEELADFSKYQVKEIRRLEKVTNDWKERFQDLKEDAEKEIDNLESVLEKVSKERDEFKRQYIKAHAEIQDLQYKLKVAEKPEHDCSKNQGVIWKGKDIVKVYCSVCNKTLYEA